eukprot:scaffold168025_cov39-Tisochrysis_lutea.AAC.2
MPPAWSRPSGFNTLPQAMVEGYLSARRLVHGAIARARRWRGRAVHRASRKFYSNSCHQPPRAPLEHDHTGGARRSGQSFDASARCARARVGGRWPIGTRGTIPRLSSPLNRRHQHIGSPHAHLFCRHRRCCAWV